MIANVAQLAERQPSKLDVAGSLPVVRSNFDSDTSKEEFRAAWPTGYIELFGFGYPEDAEFQVAAMIARYADPEHSGICLEAGCGGGFWTKRYLAKFFKEVICIDLIEKSLAPNLPNIRYIEVGDRDYSCAGVPDNSVDFAFSFGMFCHLSQPACQAYLSSWFRVLRPGGVALAAFANCPRHGGELERKYANERQGPGTCWFYSDVEMVKSIVEAAGFIDFHDTLPKFRDTLAYFKKPLPA